jgi:hypothetical protein
MEAGVCQNILYNILENVELAKGKPPEKMRTPRTFKNINSDRYENVEYNMWH